MTQTTSAQKIPSIKMDQLMQTFTDAFASATRPIRAFTSAAVFFLKVFPMIPSRPVDWITRTPVVEKVKYPTRTGQAAGEVYRPSGPGPHPGIVVCLGVVPFEVDHPQVPVLGKALARAGFAALLYWSPAMRDFRLDPDDIENLALAYRWLVEQPYIDPARSGLLGTCVGGSYALMAAANPLVRERVAFLSAYAPFSSMWTFARDIASKSRCIGKEREPWKVDPLTRKVFVHSMTAWLEPKEAEQLRDAFAEGDGQFDGHGLSAEGKTLCALFASTDADSAEAALHNLSPAMKERLSSLSPLNYVKDLCSPVFVQLHDVGDQLIPISESRQLHAALEAQRGMFFTEMQFSHLDPVKGKLPLFRLVREFGKFFLSVYPVFRQAAA